MAHPINDRLNKLEGRVATPCNDKCEYWAFPHLETACGLSSVFSVPKGRPCFEFTESFESVMAEVPQFEG